jgi:hypothetical protein
MDTTEATREAFEREWLVLVESREATTVQVNGVSYDIPRGKEWLVPESVARLLAQGGFIDVEFD